MRVRLEAVKGPVAGKLFVFEEPDIFIFGRAQDATCSIPTDNGISRRHFMIQFNPPDCTLTDLGSLNGTIVNRTQYGGKPDKVPGGYETAPPGPVRLGDGDRIIAGRSQFRVGVTYDLVCDACGVKFVAHGDAELARMGNVPVCDECSRLGAGEARPQVTQFVACSRCGRDVTQEAGARAVGGHVDYVCATCRKTTIHGDELRAALRAQRESGEGAIGLAGDFPPPPPIEGYEHLRLLGVGGMGAVYLSKSVATGELVAVKTLLPEVAVKSEAVAIFERETDVAASLRHPNIVRIHRRGNVGAEFYFVMEYIDGTDVDYLVTERGGRLPLEESVDVALQVLDGLAYAHEQGYVHRDVKPANILVEEKAEPRRAASAAEAMEACPPKPWRRRAVLTDFGLAKSFEQAGLSGLTTGESPRGSLWYIPREQIIRYRWVRPTSDVYAMGATLYYMLTGMPVKEGLEDECLEMPAAVRAITEEPCVPLRERDRSLPRAVAAVVDKSLMDEESKRYRNAGSMRRALLRATGGWDQVRG
jgi:hypothetical protein